MNSSAFCLALALQLQDPPSAQKSLWLSVVAEHSPKAEVLAIGNRRGGVHVVDFATGELRRLRGPTGTECARVAWSADGSRLAVRAVDGRLDSMGAQDGRITWTAETPKPGAYSNSGFWFTTSLAFVDGDRRLLVAGGAAGVQLLCARDGKLLAEFGGADGKATAIALDARRERVAVGSETGVVRLYSTKDGSPIAGPWTVPKPVNELAISPAEDVVAVGAGDALVRLLSLDGKSAARQFSYSDMNMWGDLQIGHVAFSGDGERLLASSFSSWGMRCWDVASGAVVSDYDTWSGGPCSYPAFLVDDGRTMVGGLHGVVRRMRVPAPDLLLAPKDRWTRFAASGRLAWTVSSYQHMFAVYDVRDGAPVFSIDIAELENDEIRRR